MPGNSKVIAFVGGIAALVAGIAAFELNLKTIFPPKATIILTGEHLSSPHYDLAELSSDLSFSSNDYKVPSGQVLILRSVRPEQYIQSVELTYPDALMTGDTPRYDHTHLAVRHPFNKIAGFYEQYWKPKDFSVKYMHCQMVLPVLADVKKE